MDGTIFFAIGQIYPKNFRELNNVTGFIHLTKHDSNNQGGLLARQKLEIVV